MSYISKKVFLQCFSPHQASSRAPATLMFAGSPLMSRDVTWSLAPGHTGAGLWTWRWWRRISLATLPMESGILSVRRDCWVWSAEDCKFKNSSIADCVLSRRGSRTEGRAFLRLLRGAVPGRHLHRGDAQTDPLLRPQPTHPLRPHLHPGPVRLPPACWLWGEDFTRFTLTHKHTHFHFWQHYGNSARH